MGRVFGGGGGGAGSSPVPSNYSGRVGLNNINNASAAFQVWRQKQDQVDTVNQIYQGTSNLSYSDQLNAIKTAHTNGLINDDDMSKVVGQAYKIQQGKDQQQEQQQFNQNTGGTGVLGNVERAAAGVGGMVNDGVVQPFKDFVHNIADTINTQVALDKQGQDLQLQKSQQTYLQSQVQAGKITQQQASQGMSKINAQVNDDANGVRENMQLEQQRDSDPLKEAGAAATTFLNGATLGLAAPVEAGIRAAATDGAETVAKEGIAGLAKRVIGEVPIGAAAGASNTVASEGKNTKIQDVAFNALTGAGTAAALPVAGRVLGAVGHTIAGAVTNRAAQQVAQAAEDIKLNNDLKSAAANKGAEGSIGSTSGGDGKGVPSETVPGVVTHAPTDTYTVDQHGTPVTIKGTPETANLNTPTAMARVGDNTAIGKLDNTLGAANRAVADKVGSAVTAGLGKIPVVGDRLAAGAHNFGQTFVEDSSNALKMIQKGEDAGELPTGATRQYRGLLGNLNRTGDISENEMKDVQGVGEMSDAVNSLPGKNSRANYKALNEYAGARSEVELAAAGEKKFDDDYLQQQKDTVAKYEGGPNHEAFQKYYQGLVNANRDLLEKRHNAGLITDEEYNSHTNAKYDYVHQQREIAQWRLDNQKGFGSGRSVSFAKSAGTKARNAFAHNKVLNPLESYRAAYHLFAAERARNNAGSFLQKALEATGNGKMIRTADMVEAKHAILHDAHDGRIALNKAERIQSTQKVAVNRLATKLNNLNRQGLNIATKGVRDTPKTAAARELKALRDSGLDIKLSLHPKPREVKALVESLITMDPKGLNRVRSMIARGDTKMEGLLDSLENINRDVEAKALHQQGLISDAKGIHINPNTSAISHFEAVDRGVKTIIKTTPEFAEAAKHLNPPQLGTVLQIARVTNNIFKAGTTGVNPVFTVKNLVRDWAQSMVTSDNIFQTHLNPTNYIKTAMFLSGHGLTAEEAETMDKIAAGYEGSLRVNQYRNPVQSKTSARMQLMEDAPKLQKLGFTVTHPLALKEKLDGILGVTESGERMMNGYGTYKAGIKQGLSHDEALSEGIRAARENTTDFNQAGKFGRIMNQIIPYSNATIQDGRLIARSFRDKPASTLAKFTVGLTIPTVASTAWNISDPNRKAVYDEIPGYVKQTNLVIVMPGAKMDPKTGKFTNVILVPRPQGLAQLTEPARIFTEQIGGDNPQQLHGLMQYLTTDGGQLASDFASTFSPIDVSSPSAFIGSVLPSWAKAPLEATVNYNFYEGRPIVPQSEQSLPAADQVSSTTRSQLSTYIGGLLGVSPLLVDNSIKEMFGGLGQQVQNTVDKDVLGGKADNVDPITGRTYSTIGGQDTGAGIKSSFYGAPGGNDQTAFYNAYNPVYAKQQRVEQQVSALAGQGKTEQAKRVASDFNNSIAGYFQSFKAQYSSSPTYDKSWDDSIKKLTINTSAQSMNQRYRAYQKKQQSQN